MVIEALKMKQLYELLAFVVALYFPVALVTWLVIDKFFAPSEDESNVPRPQGRASRQNRIFVDHSGRQM